MIRFGGNDYLDLARHPKLVEASIQAAREHGASTCASRVSVGTCSLHLRLEEELALFLGVEETVVLASGYLAAIAAFQTCDGGRVLLDGGAHPSLKHGALACGAAIRTFGHFDAFALEAALSVPPREAAAGAPARQSEAQVAVAHVAVAQVAVDGVDGFSGVAAPLDRLREAAARHGARMIIDEAHGTGILGNRGRGAAELFGVPAAESLLFGSFGKAFASSGGWVAGSRDAMSAVRAGAAYMGSTALAPPAAGAALAALDIIREEGWRRERILRLGSLLRRAVRELGFACAETVASKDGEPADFPVVTLALADANQAARLAARLLELGIQVAYFAYAASASSSRLRLPVSARHGEADIHRLLQALEKARVTGAA